jgi:hypothetical protein
MRGSKRKRFGFDFSALNLFRPGHGFNVVIELQLMDLKYTDNLFALVVQVRSSDSSARPREEVKSLYGLISTPARALAQILQW